MKFRIAIAILALGIFGACSSAKNHPPKNEKETLNPEEMPETEGYGTVEGIVTVRGTLDHTKGSMAQIGKMIVSGSELGGEGQKIWSPEYEAMVGKTVEAKGEHYRYHCGTHEQCLSGGVINYLRKIEYIKLAE